MSTRANKASEALTILIVDDSPTQIEQLKYLLEQHAYHVTAASNGLEALSILDKETPALIITDIVMPKMNGYELCHQIKSDTRTSDIPVILLTSLASPDDVLEGLACCADAFLTKPYNDTYLLTHVQQILANRILRSNERVRIGAEIFFAGKRRFISADQQQILSLLLSTYEAAVNRNNELNQTQEELRTLNESLEEKVEERTAELSAEIVERKKAEESLRASETKYRTIVDNVGMGVTLIGQDMRLIELNRQMMTWFPNVPRNDNPLCYQVFNNPPFDAPCPQCPVIKALYDCQVHEITRENTIEGKQRTFRIVASPVFDAQGDISGIIEIVEDVTERLILEQQFHQAQKMESIGQLAGGVAHDFNNILQAIIGYSQMLLDSLKENDACYEFGTEIARGAERATALTRQLLAFSRRQVLKMEDLDLNEVIGNVMKMVKRVIGEHIQARVIPGHKLGTIHADRGQMEQVLMNLCVNARDAMPEGGVLSIETENVVFDDSYCASHSWAIPGRHVLLSVTDSGIGMDAHTLERVFEPFFTTKELGKGTGLGLATVYGIVRQHQGMIQVYSEVNKGSTFKIYLPIVERVASSIGTKLHSRPTGGSETILLAEDDDAVRTLVTRILQRAGYTILTAANGREALRLFRESEHPIDMVLADVVMPELGGKALFDALRAEQPQLRFLFSSGYSTNAVHTGFVLHEGIQLIQKPYAPDTLLRKVREVLDQPTSSKDVDS